MVSSTFARSGHRAATVGSVTFLAVLMSLSGCSASGVSRNPVNVLLVVLDTTRADALSCYGNPRRLTPNLDAVAREGVLFARAQANSAWTLPSHASMFTGKYPMVHRATQETLVLPDEADTLAEILTRAGYRTLGASTNAVLNASSGLQQGFESFHETFRKDVRAELSDAGRHPHHVLLQQVLSETPVDRPFFAFFNFIDPHVPYDPPPRYRQLWVADRHSADEIEAAMQAKNRPHYLGRPLSEELLGLRHELYEAEVAKLDDLVGGLLAILHADGRLDETLVIITSDHGENFGEHALVGHNFCLYETLVHVPLLVRLPGGGSGGTRREDPVQLVDLFPTILRWAAVEAEDPHGRDLFAEGAERAQPAQLAEYYFPAQVLSGYTEQQLSEHAERFIPFMRRLRSVREGSFKLIRGSDGRSELYDLEHDPHETDDLLLGEPGHEQRARLTRRLDELVERYIGNDPLPPPPTIDGLGPGLEERLEGDPELLERLRSLGYVGGG